jgi:hypothetical protein
VHFSIDDGVKKSDSKADSGDRRKNDSNPFGGLI